MSEAKESNQDDAERKEKEAAALKRMKEQWTVMAQKAFCDLLKQRVEQEPPDYEWITRLYEEIRNKLTKILKKGSELRVEIEEAMDVELFDQMIRNKAFNPTDLYKLIHYTFDKCKQLGSAGRDKETDAKLKEITDHMQTGDATFASIVPLYIKNINYCIDKMYYDLEGVSKVLNQNTKK